MITAAPRIGDGYANGGPARRGRAPVDRGSLKATVALPQRTYRDTVVTRDLSGLGAHPPGKSFFARGIGLVAQQTTEATSTSLALLRVRGP